jgi:hypothetical protein
MGRAAAVNRKARRAGKAMGRAEQPPLAFDEARFRAAYERRRAEREARAAALTDADLLDLRLAEDEAVGWSVLFLACLLDAVPLWAHRHYRTDPDARVGRAHELGESIAYSQGAAAIADKDSPPVRKGEHSTANAFNAIAEGLAIGAYCPDGAAFGGMHWQVVGSSLRVTNRGFCSVYPLADEAFWHA